MAKPSNGNNKPNNTAPVVPASETQDAGQQNLQEGAAGNAADQNNTADEARVTDLAFSFPDESVEGIKQVVTLLKEAYPNEDIDARLADFFKPEAGPVINEDNGNIDLGGTVAPHFELVFPMDHLADNITEGLLAVQTALDERRAPEGVTFPEELVGFQFPLTVLERYIQATLLQERRLEEVELVFADPDVDSHLKTLNFSRYLQGLDPTRFYLRFL